MSRRNSLAAKAERRKQRTSDPSPLDSRVNLIDWIKLRANVTTTEAVKLIMHGVLRVDSHKIGVVHTPQGAMLSPLVAPDVARRIEIVLPEEKHEDPVR